MSPSQGILKLRVANSVWKNREDHSGIVEDVQKNVSAGLDQVNAWLEDVGDDEMKPKPVPEGWMTAMGEEASKEKGEEEQNDNDSDAAGDDDESDDLFEQVPTVEECAIYIWNEAASIERQLKEKAKAADDEEANHPGTKWAEEHGKLVFTLPSEMCDDAFDASEYPFTVTAVKSGLLETPYPYRTYVKEALAPLSALWNSEEMSRVTKAALHYISNIIELAGDGGEHSGTCGC